MAVPGITAAAPSPGKTPPRSTVPPPIWAAMWPRTWSPPGLAPRCEVQIAYCIGVAEPVSVLVSSLGTSDIPDEVLTKAVREVFDLRPYHITKRLDLLRPIYKKTSCYGHFGRELPEFTWEHTDAAADLRTAAKV